jgi:glutathione-regulated potassium-efflux system protein KefB
VEHDSVDLTYVVALLGAMVVMVPIFRRLGLGSILGYLAAGLAIGPFGLGWLSQPEAVMHIAELGVIMFLFVVGLEMRPSHLWNLRREIFGLGSLQIFVVTLLLVGLGLLFGNSLLVALFGALGFVLTSTAVVMQTLEERGDTALPRGQRIVAILLFEDLLIVPLLALVAFLSPDAAEHVTGSRWTSVLIGVASLAGLIGTGYWLLNPMFRLLAAARAREVMTAAALLVVLGAALLMQLGGLSMALGAFLAGVLLSESSFRHQIETDIEPFRGILLGLFFLSVGMTLDLNVVLQGWVLVASTVVAMMFTKGVAIYGVARLLKTDHEEALQRAVLMAQGGEFAFVLFAAAVRGNLLEPKTEALLSAAIVLSMALTPLVMIAFNQWLQRRGQSLDGVEAAEGLSGSVLLIGFGRFGQVTCQALLARDADVTIIDVDADMIRTAAEFGFKVYYGDGTRLDVLRHSGAGSARVVAVCVDNRAAARKIVELVQHEFPQAKVLVRSYDRQHSLELVKSGVTYQIRETFESALRFGEAALLELGESPEDAAAIAADVRRRDAERFELEIAKGPDAARALLRGNVWKPTPLTAPRREGRTLKAEEASEPAP